ncbi:sialidase family protein [Methylobacterium sp. SyP6R]|uniref:sialidase family protein n=1 Tax=Methylobacterium sp. SyP6R TaxID=2718876 RepID=UPI001F418209|nr:exo-alpha-sialidase [Methylobacterium sp. SyP6R]MCF4129533.1 exo-alpha-sialidase [Methylobacterium sp. SyP6R]
MLDTIETPMDRTGEVRPVAGDPLRREAFIPSPCVQNHAANILPLPNGDLACVWFGGTQEGMADISVYGSRLPAGSDTWTEAQKLSDDASRSEQNPILFNAPTGELWLIWTAQVSGNQDTALVRRRISHDHGLTWGPIETLFAQRPGCGTFVRQPPAVLKDGTWLLPIFHCPSVPGAKWVGDDDTSAVMISSDQGRTWREVAVPDSTGAVHMNVLALHDGTLLALYRSRWADSIYESRSTDGGETWSAPVPTALPNNNSSVQATLLANGHVALVFNATNAEAATERRASLYDEIEDEEPAPASAPAAAADPGKRTAFWGTPRAPLTLAISPDGGRTWPHRRDLEVGDGYCMTNNSRDRSNRELSYPSVTQTPDGAIHVAFTYHRQAIKYVRVSEAWVSAGE